MQKIIQAISPILLMLIGLTIALEAHAVPSFARKYEMNCSGCHTAYPQLNSTGRKFKEAGYRFPTDGEKDVNQEVSDFLQLEKHVPLSAVLVSRPYDKKDSGETKNRAIHEVELMYAGNLARNWAGFFELEAEDEEDFEPEIGPAVLTYNHSEMLNVQAGWSPIFWADSYDILNSGRRMTRGNVGAIDQSFGGADGDSTLIDLRQNFGIYGRFGGRFFYNVNWSGDAKDAEGESASTLSALLNVDISDNIMLGVFGLNGTSENNVDDTVDPPVELPDRDYTRVGAQFQADIADARLQAIYVAANDDLADGVTEEDNNTYSIQGFWTFRDKSLKPTWVPLIRLDSYEENDGSDKYSDLTLNLTYYFTHNIKAFAEYWDRFDAPTSVEEDDRLTIQIIGAF